MFENIGSKAKGIIEGTFTLFCALVVLIWIAFLVIFFKNAGYWVSSEQKLLVVGLSILVAGLIIFFQYLVTIMSMCIAQITLNTDKIVKGEIMPPKGIPANNVISPIPEVQITEPQTEKNEVPEELKF